MSQESRVSIVIDLKDGERKLSNLRKIFDELDDSTDSVGDGLDEVGDGIDKAGRKANKSSSSLSKLKSAFRGVAGVASVLGGAISAIGLSQVAGVQREFDVLNASLITATGSAENASKAFDEIKKFASETPYDLQQSVEGFTKLKNLGLDPSMESMRSFGNTASAMGKDMMQMIEAVADASTGEFERLKEFGIKASKQGDKVAFTFQGVTTTVANNSKDIQQYLLDIGNTNFDGAMAQRMDTLDGAFSNLGDSYNNLLLTISQSGVGDTIKKAVLDVAEVLNSVSEYIQSPEAVKIYSTALDGLSTAWQAVKDGIQGVTDLIVPVIDWFKEHEEISIALASGIGAVALGFLAFNGAIIAWTAIGALATGVTAAFGAAVAIATSPVTLIALAIAGLVAVGVYLYRNWDTIKTKATEVFNSLPAPVQEAFANIKQTFSTLKQWATTTFDFLAPYVKATMEVVSALFTAHWSIIKGIFTTAFSAIKATISSSWQTIKALFTAGITGIAIAFNAGFDTVKTIVSTAFNAIKALAKGDIEGFKSIVKTGLSKLKDIALTAISKFLDTFKTLKDKLVQIGKDAIQGLINGIKDKIGGAISVVTGLAGKVAGAFTKVLDIHSPSRLFKKFGGYIVDGLKLGIDGKASEAVQSALNLAQQISNTMSNIKKEMFLMSQEGELGDSFNKALATFDYDRANGAYAGIKDSVLDSYRELIQAKEELIEKTRLENEIAKANENVLNSIASINQQLALGDNATGVEKLQYAMKNTNQYANVSDGNMANLMQATALQDLSGIRGELGQQESDPFAKLQEQLAQRQNIIQTALDAESISRQEYNDLMLANEQKFHQARNALALTKGAEIAGSLTSIAKDMAGEQSGIYRAMFAVEKGFAIAKAMMNIQTAMSDAAASLPFPANLGAIATVATNVAGIVSNIKSITMPVGQAHDGIMSVPKSGTWNLEKGERVLPQHTAQALDKKLASNDEGKAVNVIINNYTSEQVQQSTNSNGDIEIIVGKELAKQLPHHVNNPYSNFNRAMKQNYQLQRRTA